MMCVNIFSSFISFYVSFVILCPSSLAIEVSVYDWSFDSKPVHAGTSYKMHFHSGTISVMCDVFDIKDNLHVTAYRDDTICIDTAMHKYMYSGCRVRVSLSDVTTAYVLERNASSVSTSTASTTTREPVTSVLAATDQPETVVASENWTATIVTVAVTSAAVLLLALITVACIRLCRARTPGQPASDRFWNRFYVNMLMRDECNAEIRERERRDAEIREGERREAEPEYDYVYDHRYAPRTQRTR
nr:uncharacterized protein LOC110381912 isoform X3 [Helicoverpa armigera]